MTRWGREFDDDRASGINQTEGFIGCLFSSPPRKPGAQGYRRCARRPWMPAFAGMTVRWVNAER